MTIPREVIFDPVVALIAGFVIMLVLCLIWIMVTTCKPWHRAFHLERGINRAYSCDHCWRDYYGSW